MKRVVAVLLFGVGLAALLFGLLFLIGSAGQSTRLAVAAVGLVCGALLTGVGVRLFKLARHEDPDFIKAELLTLAKREDGEISEHELRGALGARWPRAQEVLLVLQGEGVCRLGNAAGGSYYTFPQLQPRLAVRRCEFCQAELPLDDELVSCPQCGGTIKTGVKRVSVGDGEVYSMDPD